MECIACIIKFSHFAKFFIQFRVDSFIKVIQLTKDHYVYMRNQRYLENSYFVVEDPAVCNVHIYKCQIMEQRFVR